MAQKCPEPAVVRPHARDPNAAMVHDVVGVSCGYHKIGLECEIAVVMLSKRP